MKPGWALLIAALAFTPQNPPPATPAQAPVFRSGATLVPVDVRVLDAKGRPITDLRRDEFVVREGGQPQVIAHFAATALTPATGDAVAPLLRAGGNTGTIAPPTGRVFLLMLGRGRLQPPSKGVDAMLEFVRQRVLPQDQVAVMAWNRATDLTTDHAGLAELLERFKKAHEGIEGGLASWFSGLRALYGDKTIPDHIQQRIDDVFAVPALRPAHSLVTDPNEKTPTSEVLTKQAEALQLAEARAGRPVGSSIGDAIDPVASMGIDGNLEDFLRTSIGTNQDLASLYAAIEYLRFIEGEKHIVFVTENGLAMPDFSSDRALASAANHARVAIDVIQTGGVPSMRDATFTSFFAMQSLRNIAEATGGVASVHAYADQAVRRIDDATRFAYQLGYYPSRGVEDGTYRQIRVTVTRPGAQVFYRHGYFAQSTRLLPDRRNMLTYTRMATALGTGIDVGDIPIKVKARDERVDDGWTLVADVTVQVAKLSPLRTAAGREYTVELALVCADRDRNAVGQFWQRMHFTIPDALYDKMLAQGLPAKMSVHVPLTGYATQVKTIVYDFDTDLLGSLVTIIR